MEVKVASLSSRTLIVVRFHAGGWPGVSTVEFVDMRGGESTSSISLAELARREGAQVRCGNLGLGVSMPAGSNWTRESPEG
jgi:hypothetical protein